MEIFAHRGIHDENIKENSRGALEKIYSSSAHGIEVDLRLTLDGVCVLNHSTKNDSKLLISRHTFRQLKNVDPELLQLDEAFEILQDYRGVINLEIKHIFGERDKNLGRKCVEVLLKKRQLFESGRLNILFSSFSKDNIFVGSELLQEIPRALLVARPLRLSKVIKRAKVLDCEAIHVSLQRSKYRDFERFVQQAREENIKVRVYTVNDLRTYKKLDMLGVDGVFTDHVEKFFSKKE